MGQKVSPIGMRVGVIRDWESRWYAEADYGTLLNEDIKIRKYMDKALHAAYVSRVEIERTGNEVKLIVRCSRPGVITSKDDKGASMIDTVKKELTKITGGKSVKIDVVEIANPDLDARLVARKIAEGLEARQSFRTCQKKAIQQTMRSGAKGIKTMVSGRLGGADIARSEGYSEGVVPLHTLRSDIDYAWEEAMTTYGKLGVKVWICRGEVLPGEMVKEPEAPKMPNRGPRRPRRDNNRRPRNEQRTAAPAEKAPATEGGN
ncbi:MAG: 30S ribosomal protein S3 [Erysipelotrichaceae bacterium]|nr:30S ribosomal protein S3 [Erysipelotrichaceae bacterium]